MFIKAVKNKKITVEYPTNQKFTIGGAAVEILGPNKIYKHTNDNSVVARVAAGKFSMLLAGDEEKAEETDLLPKMTPVTVDKVSHHSSSTSSGQYLLSKIKPKIAFI